jgi:trehalose 6-phosphate phosphatase
MMTHTGRMSAFSLDQFFRQVREEPRRLLALDYEGVLRPILEADDDPEGPSSTHTLLNSMLAARHTRVVVASERPAHDLPPLLRLTTPVEIFGSNGLEHLRPHGAYTRLERPARAEAGFAQAHTWCAVRGIDHCLEQQLARVTLRRDTLPPGAATHLWDEVVDQWVLIAWPAGLELRANDERIELITERDAKDRLVERLLDEAGEGAAFAYLADGLDDERAFRALRGRGLGVLVTRTPRKTFASLQIATGDETIQFLRRWHQQANGRAGTEAAVRYSAHNDLAS